MHDPFPSIWADRMARLPAVTTLTIRIEPNRALDYEVTCMVCRRAGPCEWIALKRTANESIMAGLCESCRERTQRMTDAKATKGGE